MDESTSRQSGPRLLGLRGATSVDADETEAIVEATAELLTEMLERNGASPEDVVSVLLTATPDLTAEFPAAGARRIGLTHTPLLCAREIDVAGAAPRCIRVLVHLYSALSPDVAEHVYLREARGLRTDLG
jgi:chorismate mutase